jgi:hypothetical protein
MPESYGRNKLMSAAANGDVMTISLVVKHAGVNVSHVIHFTNIIFDCSDSKLRAEKFK